MRVILRDAVDSLGGKGDIVDVADGYAVNYLVPRGLAMRATRGAIADADAMRAARGKREAQSLGDARGLADTIEAAPVQVRVKADEDGTLYGSVGTTAIVAAVAEQRGLTLTKKQVPVPKPLKTVGSHEVEVRVHPELSATLRVEVVSGE